MRGAVRVQRPMVASLLLNALDALPIERSVVTAATAVGASASRNEQPSERASSQPEKRTIANFRAEIDSRTAPPVAAPPADTLLPRALVIDDSPTVRKRLELALRAAYVDVDAAVTGEDGLQLIATRNYDIVFLDVVLPGEDGYKICKTIKNDPSLRHTPVVMLTSRSSPFDRIRGSLAGCNSYLTKPVDKGLFEKTLKKYVPNAIISGKADGVPLVSA